MNRAPQPPSWPARRPVMLGVLALGLLLGGLGGWSVTAHIAGAIVAPGEVAVEQNRQVIQHPDGGVVAEIGVREGDSVDRGALLLRLDDSLLGPELAIVEGQLFELRARLARLEAERDDAETVTFAPDLVEMARESAARAEILDGQRRLFDARRESLANAIATFRRRQEQIASQIAGIQAQQTALERQLALIRRELTDQRRLLERGLTQSPRVLALEREEARLAGQVGQLVAAAAEADGRRTEIDLEVLKLESTRREEAIARIRDLEVRRVELEEKRRQLSERLSRLEVRAPIDGVVYGLRVFSPGSVIQPAEPVMFIVPQDSDLVITSQISPLHIDEVHPDQTVRLRFAAFNARTTPEILGRVWRVSPDAFRDEARGTAYYRAEIRPLPGEIARLGGRIVVPGMPVEAFFETEEHTPFEYLVKPFADYFNRAFREN